jgi:hypothetical protein
MTADPDLPDSFESDEDEWEEVTPNASNPMIQRPVRVSRCHDQIDSANGNFLCECRDEQTAAELVALINGASDYKSAAEAEAHAGDEAREEAGELRRLINWYLHPDHAIGSLPEKDSKFREKIAALMAKGSKA